MSNARFSILQARAVKDKRISDAQFRTLAALGMYADEDGWCFPSLTTLGDDLGKSKQAVGRDTIALRKLGYLEVKAQYRDDGSRSSNLYRLTFDFTDPPRQPDVDAHQPQELTLNEEEGNVFKAFEENISPLTSMLAESLGDLIDEHSPGWVIAAIKEAAENGKRNLKYIAAILRRWKADGYGTPHPKSGQERGAGESFDDLLKRKGYA